MITDESGDNHRRILASLSALPAAMMDGMGVIFRNYEDAARAENAAELAHLCQSRKLPLLIAKDPDLARSVNADGLHLPEYLLPRLAEFRAAHPDWLISAAVHDHRKMLLGPVPDLFLLSPVYKTRSHPQATTLGAETFNLWAEKSPAPVFALGGIDEKNAAVLTRASGIAGIGCFIDR